MVVGVSLVSDLVFLDCLVMNTTVSFFVLIISHFHAVAFCSFLCLYCTLKAVRLPMIAYIYCSWTMVNSCLIGNHTTSNFISIYMLFFFYTVTLFMLWTDTHEPSYRKPEQKSLIRDRQSKYELMLDNSNFISKFQNKLHSNSTLTRTLSQKVTQIQSWCRIHFCNSNFNFKFY